MVASLIEEMDGTMMIVALHRGVDIFHHMGILMEEVVAGTNQGCMVPMDEDLVQVQAQVLIGVRMGRDLVTEALMDQAVGMLGMVGEEDRLFHGECERRFQITRSYYTFNE